MDKNNDVIQEFIERIPKLTLLLGIIISLIFPFISELINIPIIFWNPFQASLFVNLPLGLLGIIVAISYKQYMFCFLNFLLSMSLGFWMFVMWLAIIL